MRTSAVSSASRNSATSAWSCASLGLCAAEGLSVNAGGGPSDAGGVVSQLGLNCSSGFISGGVTSQLGLFDSCASDSAHDSQLGVDCPLGVDPAASLRVDLDGGAETYEPCVDPRDSMPLSIVDTFAVDNAEQTDPVRSSSAASNSRSASGVQVVVGGSTACVVTSTAFTSALAILNAWLFTLAISEAVVSSWRAAAPGSMRITSSNSACISRFQRAETHPFVHRDPRRTCAIVGTPRAPIKECVASRL